MSWVDMCVIEAVEKGRFELLYTFLIFEIIQ